MAVSNVELRVDARQAVNALQQVNSASGRASVSTEKLSQAINGSSAAMSRQANASRQSISGVNALAGSIGRLTAAYVSLQTAQQAIQAGIQREESTRRLTFLARGYNEVAQAQESAARVGRQFGLSATEANQQFAQLYGRLRPLNVSVQDIEAAFVGFNTAAKVSGATSAESAGALLQLTQALGSGVLRGQELNSVLEQAPGLVVALTKELDRPVNEIRKLAEEGLITSDVVIRALKRAGTDGADELAEALNGPSQRVKDLQNAFEDLQVVIAQVFGPIVKNVLQGVTADIQTINTVIVNLGNAWNYAASTISPFIQQLNVIANHPAFKFVGRAAVPQLGRLDVAQIGGRLFNPAGALVGDLNKMFSFTTPRGSSTPKGALPKPTPMPTPVPLPTGSQSGRGGRSAADKAARDAERAAEAAAKEAARVQEVIRSRLAEGQVMRLNSEIQDRIAAAEVSGDQMLAARLKGQQRELDIQYRYAQELAKEKDINAQKAIIFEGQTALVANQRDVQRELNELQRQYAQNQMDSLKKYIEMQYEANTAVQQQLQLADSVANTLGEGLSSAFGALISGAQDWEKSLKSIASGVLLDIANQLIRIFIIEQAINAIRTFLTPFSPSTPLGAGGGTVGRFGTFGPNYGIPQRANGGSVMAGQGYLVGERGPELFMPGRSGAIAPNGTLGGGMSVVVNVDANGTNVQGDQSQGAALGRAIAAAVQAELVKQRRPGGLLTV